MTGTSTDSPTDSPTGSSGASTELVPHQCWELLRRQQVGRLALCGEDGPVIFPVNYIVDHGTVVFRTAAGTKLSGAAGRQVAFEADGWDDPPTTAWSVVLRGRAVKVLEREENLRALRLPLVVWQEGHKPWFVRVEPQETTGRRFLLAGAARHAVHEERP